VNDTESEHPLWFLFVDWYVQKYGMQALLSYRGTRQKWEAFKAGAEAQQSLEKS
jgi:hypothetical protein